MFNKKKIVYVLSVVVSLTIVSSYYYYQGTKFKRSYEHGTIFEQLDTLLNTTRSAKYIEKAGYKLDQYDLKVGGVISSVPINDNPLIDISRPMSNQVDILVTEKQGDEYIRYKMTYDENMELIDFYAYSEQKNRPNKNINNIQKKDILEYYNLVKKNVTKFLDKVYKII
ncbi:hypothetical protein ACQ3MN_07875 [Enterococcus faecalis]|uniref:hypothetical protein n=1 Tax=Enterococcus faecalis TaxID=1351 RepID=UPI003D773D86